MSTNRRTLPHWFNDVRIGELRWHICALAEADSEPSLLEVAVGSPEVFIPVSRVDFRTRTSCIEVKFRVSDWGRDFLNQLLDRFQHAGVDFRERRSQKKSLLSQVSARFQTDDSWYLKAVEELIRKSAAEVSPSSDGTISVGYGYGKLPSGVPGRFQTKDLYTLLGYTTGRILGSLWRRVQSVI